MADDVQAEIDRLYQLPLDQFTAERNSAAKRLGKTQPPIKELVKPSVPAWGVNQLYWQERSSYDALVEASERLRTEHRKLLAGKAADVRDSEKAHRDAIKSATAKVKDILVAADQAVTQATVQAVTETLEALPSSEPPGRLVKPLKPLGFEALSGIAPRGAASSALRLASSSPGHAADSKAAAAAAKREAEQARREAEHAKREEAKEKERQRQAQADVRRAEATVAKAQEALDKTEREALRLRRELIQAQETLDRLKRLI
jgi:hypothetical protein